MQSATPRRRTLIFATRNRGKLVELEALLGGLGGLELWSLDGFNVPPIEEDGSTFHENAAKKARVVSQITGLPALADDSGLEVDALGGAPGVWSARYAGEGASDQANNDKLLAALAGVPAAQRTARFRSVVALADEAGSLGGQVLYGEGRCEGVILEAPRGTGGFGYDPLFFAPELGATFAELGLGPKNDLSHRARAFRDLRPRLAAYFDLEIQTKKI